MADVYFYKNIEFDINGSYTMDFLNASGAFSSTVRDNYFNARLFTNISDNNIYMRESIPTRVAYNIDALRNAGVNYIKYRNLDPTTNRFSIWYYAFIENMEYIDANTTAIVIKIDVLQTYLKELYESTYQNVIERCHQNRYDIDGNPIFNTLSDIPAGDHELESVKYFNPINDIVFYLIASSEEMDISLEASYPFINRTPPIIQNTYNSFYYYIIPAFKNPEAHLNDVFVVKEGDKYIPLTSLDENNTALANVFNSIKADSSKILSVYFLPFAPFDIRFQKQTFENGNRYIFRSESDAITTVSHNIGGSGTGVTIEIKTIKVSKFGATESKNLGTLSNVEFIDSKTTRNFNYSDIRDPARESKLYTSEYTQFYFSDYNTDKEIKLEHIAGDPAESEKFIRFDLTTSIVGRVSLNIKLLHYEQFFDSLKFVTDFRTQSNYEIPFSVASVSEYIHNQSASIVGGLATSTALTGKLKSRNPKNKKSESSTEEAGKYIYTSKKGAAKISSVMFDTLTDVLDAENSIDTPGNLASERAAANSLKYFGFMIYAAFPHNYNVICDFWNLYGYPLNEYRKISEVIKSRHWFNYIKTTGAQLPNIAFLPHRIELEKLLDNGVTFWHNRNGNARPFNNYEFENAEEY